VTRRGHHVIVVPIKPLTLTIVGDPTGHKGLGRVAESGRGDMARARLALSAGGSRRRRCHALTFHRSNVLSKTRQYP